MPKAAAGKPRKTTDAELVLGTEDASLLDVVDNVLNKGVVLSGDLTIALAQVDLVYARLSLLLCAADRVLPDEEVDFFERHRQRHAARERRVAVARAIGAARPERRGGGGKRARRNRS
jgi:hypothetical protein